MDFNTAIAVTVAAISGSTLLWRVASWRRERSRRLRVKATPIHVAHLWRSGDDDFEAGVLVEGFTVHISNPGENPNTLTSLGYSVLVHGRKWTDTTTRAARAHANQPLAGQSSTSFIVRIDDEELLRNVNDSLVRGWATSASGQRTYSSPQRLRSDPRTYARYQLDRKVDVRIARAYSHLALGDWSGAVGELDAALAADSKCLHALGLRAEAQAKAADWSAAVDDYTAALANEPESVKLLLGRAKAYFQLAEWQASTDDCTAVLSIEPENATALARRATVHVNEARWQQAIDDYTAAIKQCPNDPELLRLRGGAFLELDRWHDAARDCESAFHLRPHDATVVSGWAFALGRIGDVEEATAAMQIAVDLRPDDDRLQAMLGFFLIASDPRAALELLDGSPGGTGDEGSVCDRLNRAVALLLLDDLHSAREALADLTDADLDQVSKWCLLWLLGPDDSVTLATPGESGEVLRVAKARIA